MVWNLVGSWVVEDFQFLVPEEFNSRLAVKVSSVSGLRPTWNFAGFFYQMVNLPVIGLARIDQKIATSIRDPIIFIPDHTNLPYSIRYQKADWIDSLQLTIYEDSMPLNYYPDLGTIPNPFASTTNSTTVPVSATSISLLAANPNRKKLMITNNSNQDLHVDFDATASTADYTIKIPKVPNNGIPATYELEEYTGVVSGIWAAAGAGAALVKEMVA